MPLATVGVCDSLLLSLAAAGFSGGAEVLGSTASRTITAGSQALQGYLMCQVCAATGWGWLLVVLSRLGCSAAADASSYCTMVRCQ
jgi:hypothetical protein